MANFIATNLNYGWQMLYQIDYWQVLFQSVADGMHYFIQCNCIIYISTSWVSSKYNEEETRTGYRTPKQKHHISQ